jgi:ABC-2 type transport system ATP-binding protein
MIQVRELTVKHQNEHILNGINLDINGVYGILGPNGAGKSTLLKSIMGQSKYDGIIKVNDLEKIGYLPQEFNIFPKLTVYELLEHISYLKGIRNRNFLKENILTLLKAVNLTESSKKKVKDLSIGMRRRLGIAQLLIDDPKYIIMDEPTNGLDTVEKLRFQSIIRNLSKEKTILFTSHHIDDIETLCDSVSVLYQGEIIFNGNVNDVIHQAIGVTWEATNDSIKKGMLEEIFVTKVILDSQNKPKSIFLTNTETKIPNSHLSNPSFLEGYLAILLKKEGIIT